MKTPRSREKNPSRPSFIERTRVRSSTARGSGTAHGRGRRFVIEITSHDETGFSETRKPFVVDFWTLHRRNVSLAPPPPPNRLLTQGGPTFCSWLADLHFHKNTARRKSNYTIAHVCFISHNAQIITLQIELLVFSRLIDWYNWHCFFQKPIFQCHSNTPVAANPIHYSEDGSRERNTVSRFKFDIKSVVENAGSQDIRAVLGINN